MMLQGSKARGLGTLLLLFFFIHSFYQIKTFGLAEGTYFWFCNLALLFGGLALFYQRKDVLILTLSVLIPTQLFWFIDFIKRSLAGRDVFGLTESLYHPGVSPFGFFIGHYHYVLLPTLVLGLFLLENRKTELFKGLLLLAALVLPISYFVFPYEQNINCAQANCFEGVAAPQGIPYFALFSVFMILVSYLVGRILVRVAHSQDERKHKVSFAIYGGVLLVGVFFTLLGWGKKKEIPTFACKAPFENEAVKLKCNFLNEHVPDWMILQYELTNKTPQVQDCSSFIEFEGKRELFQDGLALEPRKDLKVSILIHYPVKNTEVQLSAECKARE